MAGSGETLALAVDGLRKQFQSGKKAVQAVQGVSFTIQRGEVFALLGPNGAGKTTTIKMIANLVLPDTGKIQVAGWDLQSASTEAVSRIGAVLEGNRNIYWRMTSRENLLYFGALKRMPRKKLAARADELLVALGLEAKAHELAETLSRGMQQKLAFGCAIMHQPPLLLLDEPTLGLDLDSADRICEQVRALAKTGTGILLTTHQMDLAELLAQRVGIMREGQIIQQGGTRELLAAYEQEIFQIEVAAGLGAGRRTSLEALGVTILEEDAARSVLQVGQPVPERLYEVFQALAPLPLTSVTKQRPQLVDVFRKLTGS
ncbi:MAG TPA: ABC transporter ATP-binding protein [Hyalangium sp.]|nr:ABC transporter ATP-binding protein [Hyalangium sp.]